MVWDDELNKEVTFDVKRPYSLFAYVTRYHSDKMFDLFVKHISNPVRNIPQKAFFKDWRAYAVDPYLAAAAEDKKERLITLLEKFPPSEEHKKYLRAACEFPWAVSDLSEPYPVERAHKNPHPGGWYCLDKFLLEDQKSKRKGMRKRLAEAVKAGNTEEKEKLIAQLVGPREMTGLFKKKSTNRRIVNDGFRYSRAEIIKDYRETLHPRSDGKKIIRVVVKSR